MGGEAVFLQAAIGFFEDGALDEVQGRKFVHGDLVVSCFLTIAEADEELFTAQRFIFENRQDSQVRFGECDRGLDRGLDWGLCLCP